MRRVVLLAGPSGSGKSRVARLSACPQLALDDFYHDADHPGLPRTLGIVDWDDVPDAPMRSSTWPGQTEVPTYDISRAGGPAPSPRSAGAACFVAEGCSLRDRRPLSRRRRAR